MCRTGVHVVMLRTHQWSGPVQPAALCSPSVWRRTKQLTKVIYRTALQTTTWVSSQESFCSLFQLQVIHTTVLETALQRSLSIVTARALHSLWSERHSSMQDANLHPLFLNGYAHAHWEHANLHIDFNRWAMADDGSHPWKKGGHPMCS